MTANLIKFLINRPYYQERSQMPDHTLHAIDGTASNVLGSGFSWGSTGSFTYDEANTQIDTLVFTDNDAHLTITDTSLELLKSKNGILQNSNARVGGSWTVTGSDGSSFKVWRMLEPSHLVEGYLLFSQDLADGVTYSLSNFSLGDPMPYADIAQQTTPCFTAGTWIETPPERGAWKRSVSAIRSVRDITVRKASVGSGKDR